MQKYQRLRDLREDADLTQKQVAEYLFVHTTQYRRYECGDSEIPLDVAIKLAKLYKVSLDYIAGLTNEKMGLTKSALKDDETKLIKGYREMTERNKGRILERLDFLKQYNK